MNKTKYKIGDYVKVVDGLYAMLRDGDKPIGTVLGIDGEYISVKLEYAPYCEHDALEDELESMTSDEYFLACI